MSNIKSNNNSFQETIDRMKKLTAPGGLSLLDLNKSKQKDPYLSKTTIDLGDGLPLVDMYHMGSSIGVTTSEELLDKFINRVIEFTQQVAINMNTMMIESVFILDNNEIHTMDLIKHHTDINMMNNLIKKYIKTKNSPSVYGVISNILAKMNDQTVIIFNIQTRNFKSGVAVPINRNEDKSIYFGKGILLPSTVELITNYF